MSSYDRRVGDLVDDYVMRRIDRRQFFRRAAALGVSLPGASALLAACGGEDEAAREKAPDAAARKGGKLTLRITGDMSIVDPASWPATPDELILNTITEGLVTYKPGTFEVVNQLAESFEASPDGLRFDFKLKEGIQFHGGYGEVTSEDVKYSYERIAGLTKPKLDAPYRGDWAALKEVAIKDKYSGTIVLKEPFAPIMTSTLPVTSGHVISKKAVEERGKKYVTNPIGTGPYEFVNWRQKQRVSLKRFERYGGASSEFLGEAQWDEIDLVVVLEDAPSDIALETGEVDFAQVSLQSIGRFEENDDFATDSRTTLDYFWIGMNVLSEKLKDANVRQAIRYGVDVPAILEAAFEGRWERASAIIPPGMPVGHWEDAPVYERDVEKAKGFLQQAGVSSLDLTLTYTNDPGADSVVQIAQANLAEIGIKVKLDKVEGAAFYELGAQLRERELVYVGYITQPDPSWSTVWFICDQFDQWNWIYWCSKEFDRLHVAALKEPDQARRQEMYVQMQQVWDEAANMVWVAWPTLHWAFKKDLKPAITPHGRVLPHAFRSA